MVSSFVSVLIGVIVIFPFITSIFLFAMNKWTSKRISMRKNADYTTPFLLLSVFIIARTLFGDGTGYIILVTMIVMVLLFAVYEKRRVKDFQINVLFRKVWRLLFILLAITYVALIIIGLLLTILEHN